MILIISAYPGSYWDYQADGCPERNAMNPKGSIAWEKGRPCSTNQPS